MKPILLNICGWGPYKELQSVEFTAFYERGVFLIAGATGSGKTTIFDAITYALYGNVSGAMREKDTLRSDFADCDTQTYVELVFMHMGKEYKLYRNPEYNRPKKRKTGKEDFTKEKERAVFYLPDGTVMEGNNEVTRKVEEILCMDYRQFKQISMIAQGEFIRLLNANQKEKTEIFREIFNTAFCEEFTQRIKKKAALLANKIANVKAKMEELIEHAPIEGETWRGILESGAYHYEYICDLLKEEEKSNKKAYREAEGTLALLETEIENLWKQMEERKRVLLLFQKNENALKEYNEHIQAEEKQILNRDHLRRARKAQSIITFEMEYLRIEKQYQEIKEKVILLFAELEKSKQEGERIKNLFSKKNEAERLLDIIFQYQESAKEEKKQSILHMQVENELERCQEEYLLLEGVHKKKQEEYNMAEEHYKRAMIGIVARLVREGEPCPVCGSTNHPKIAVAEGNTPEEAEVEALKVETEKAYRECMECHTKAVRIKENIKNICLKAEEIKKQMLMQEQEIKMLGKLLKEANEEGRTLLEIDFTNINLQASSMHINALKSKLKECVVEETKRQTEYQVKEQFLYNLQQEEKQLLEVREESRQQFESQLEKAGYESDKEFQEDKMSEEGIKSIEAELEAYEQQKSILLEFKRRCEEEIKGMEKTFPEELQPILEEKKQTKANLIKQSAQYRARMLQLKEAYVFLTEKRKQLLLLEEEYGIAGELEGLVMGRNPKRLLFEQYVLLGYFDAVMEAANIRMAKMSMGRFMLHRAEGSSDGRKRDNLEIEVLDYYTGKYRSVKTLSGGEMFHTSLALALGLSDVIQLNNGGVSVETLFVDEGFGSLDEESLEQACETLLHLTQRSCMIGIISHVQELKEKIGNQIIVEKSSTGSAIRTKIN